MSLSKKHYKKIAELIGKHTVQPNKESNNNFIAYGFVWDLAKYFIEENKNFDPYIHEAVLKTESDSQDGSILNVLRNGYVMNNEVIRPAQVEIAENLKNKNNDKEK